MRIFHCSRYISGFPPAFSASLFRLGTRAFYAPSAIKKRLQQAAIAPTMISTVPITQPVRARTYGSDKTPDPIAAAHKEKILPLKLPFSSLPKVLLKTFFLAWAGDRGKLFVLMLMSPVAFCMVLGDAISEESCILDMSLIRPREKGG